MQLSRIVQRLEIPALILLLVLGFAIRLYRFNNPIADWHSWRQADTSAVSRNFVANGFDVLHPRFEDLSNVASGLDNPQGYRFVEFPIYNVAQAGLFELFGRLTLEEWGRIVSIVSSLFSAVFLYLLIKKRFGKTAGFLVSFFFLFIPFSIYYSRTILPDTSMVTATLGAIYFFQLWIEKDSRFRIYDLRFVLATVLMVAAFLLKPYAAFFTLPMIYLAYEKFGLSFIKKWQLWLFMIISLVPLGLWRLWMQQYPEGIPANAWLFNGGNIRFTGAFFYWIFADRIGRLILGYWGMALLILGFLAKYKKGNFPYVLSYVLSSLVYIVVIARGNVQHDYYQILIIPSIAIMAGIGGASLLEKDQGYRTYVNYILFFICTIFMLAFGWYFVRDYFNINDPSIIAAGAAVNRLTPKNAKVIANYNGDTSFLYQTQRNGWASFEKPLPEMVQMGAGYLALVNPTSVDLNLGKTYKIIAQTPQYVIFNLREKP